MHHKLKKMSHFQKQPPEVFYRKSYSEKFRDIYKKTPALESPFNRLAGFKTCNFFLKKKPTQGFSCERYKVFKNTYFEENFQTTASAIPASYC